MVKNLTGVHWWADSSKAKQDKVLNATITDTEIIIDYEYDGRTDWLKAHSEDGIFFIGEYGKEKRLEKTGACEFTLYENKREYLLFGGGSSAEDSEFDWYIKLKKI